MMYADLNLLKHTPAKYNRPIPKPTPGNWSTATLWTLLHRLIPAGFINRSRA